MWAHTHTHTHTHRHTHTGAGLAPFVNRKKCPCTQRLQESAIKCDVLCYRILSNLATESRHPSPVILPMSCHGMGWDGMGWDGMGWDGMG